MSFELDPRLQSDTLMLAHLPLSELLLLNDARYPWLLLVPRRLGLRELCELDAVDQKQLTLESNAVSQLLLSVFEAEKLNIAALGNMVPQLHIHHIARYASDDAWPQPVWGLHPAIPYEKEALAACIERVKKGLHSVQADWRC